MNKPRTKDNGLKYRPCNELKTYKELKQCMQQNKFEANEPNKLKLEN